MDIRNLIKKYELKSDFEDLDSLDLDWFIYNEFDLDNVDNFRLMLSEELMLDFGLYDFIGDWDRFEYGLKFYINMFKILNELDNRFDRVIVKLESIYNFKNKWRKIKKILNDIEENEFDLGNEWVNNIKNKIEWVENNLN